MPGDKMNLPPMPPGFMKPGALPPATSGAKPPVPPIAGGPKLAPPPMPGGMTAPGLPKPSIPIAPSFGAPAQSFPPVQRDAAAEETARLKEEKEKLEKKISDMERLVSQEKEKAMAAELKSKQDEVLSSKVEASLKDIQDKLRRDRHEQEVQEERLTLKSKLKELETKLVQERETWMQTLQGQMSERDTQSKDVEGHFLYRLQEMERRWLEEKAQWQRTISQKEDELRAQKYSAEKLAKLEEEFRRSAMERELDAKKAEMEKEMLGRELSRYREDAIRTEREKIAIEAQMRSLPDKERELSELRNANFALRSKEENYANERRNAEEKSRVEINRLQAEIGTIAERKNSEKEEELKKAQAKYDALLQEKEAAVAEASGEKVRAMSELLKIKGVFSRVQAINAVLEKERQTLRLEKMQMAQNMAGNIEEARKYKQESELLHTAHAKELDGLIAKHQSELQRVKGEYALEAANEHARQMAELEKKHYEYNLAAERKAQEELVRVRGAVVADYERKLGEMRAISRAELEREYATEITRLKAARAQAEEERTRVEAQAASALMSKAELERKSAQQESEKVRLVHELSALSAAYTALKTEYDKRV